MLLVYACFLYMRYLLAVFVLVCIVSRAWRLIAQVMCLSCFLWRSCRCNRVEHLCPRVDGFEVQPKRILDARVDLHPRSGAAATVCGKIYVCGGARQKIAVKSVLADGRVFLTS